MATKVTAFPTFGVQLISFNEYQKKAHLTAVYPEEHGLMYAVMGLTSEAGEVAGKAKKMIRDDGYVLSDERKTQMVDELGDVLWYVANVAYEMGVDLDDVASRNLSKLADRLKRGALKGSGDYR